MIDSETSALPSAPSKSWWDDAFTRLLLEAIPGDAVQLVEVSCGVARAAMSLMPSLPDTTYTGFSASQKLVNAARKAIEAAPFSPRAKVELLEGRTLPLEDDSIDVVLSLMDLQNEPKVEEVLGEAKRVLKPEHGRLVAVEPDNLGQRFYFDGVLEGVSDDFHRLALRARVARQPADLALGPRLPSLMQASGFGVESLVVHAVNSTRMEDAKSFFDRLGRVAKGMARDAGLPLDCDELKACDQSISRALFGGMPKRVGYSCHLVPVFRCVGVKH